MFDKQIAKKLEQVLNNMDQSKLSKVKDALQDEDKMASMLKNFDSKQASDKLKNMDLGDVLNNANLNNILNEVKNNPQILDELKKKL